LFTRNSNKKDEAQQLQILLQLLHSFLITYISSIAVAIVIIVIIIIVVAVITTTFSCASH
jgi:hypothetical protein